MGIDYRVVRSVFILAWVVCLVSAAPAETGVNSWYEVMKVNHEFLDHKGDTHQEIADLVAKARYQRDLEETGKYSGIRFIIHWQAPSSEIPKFAVKLEARGFDAGSGRETIQTFNKDYPKTPGFSGWTTLDIKGDSLKHLGKLMAWKVTLLENGQPVASRKSFTWDDSLVTSRKTTSTP